MKDLKDKISDKAYYVTQEQGTEPAFTGELLDIKEDGVFKCVCCGNPLFITKAKLNNLIAAKKDLQFYYNYEIKKRLICVIQLFKLKNISI